MNALVATTCSLEDVAVAHPDPALRRVFTNQIGVELHRTLVLTDRDEDGRLQIAMIRIAPIFREQLISLSEGIERPIHPAQHSGVMRSRLDEAWRKLEASRKEAL